MPSSSSGLSVQPRLRILAAVREGWRAFARAPWPFIGFSLLVSVLQAVCSQLQALGQVGEGDLLTLPRALAAVFGTIAGLMVSLWGTIGMVRGSWRATEGHRPQLATFTRWDPQALWRLFKSLWLFTLLLVLILLLAGVLAFLAGRISEALPFLPLLVGAALILYLSVSQKFLAQVALLEGPGMVASIRRGRQVVDPRWGQVLLLMLLEVLFLLAGLLACFVGVFVAAPVVSCISMAAYRQIFGAVDRTGLLAAERHHDGE
ncbi:MAG: hypothetical protein VKI81_06090 [Synechococcaceae cyanobacterium]|nr:hypothetical protein [Synechococcaceae cyanobacterium]